MSATASPSSSTPRTTVRAEEREHERHGDGWVTFAGMMLAIIGSLNVIYGIAAIDDANVYVGDSRYVFADLNTWGWFLAFVGAAQFVAAFSIWNGNAYGRWIGVGTASVNGIVQLLFMPAFPLLSLALFSVDVLVIYALIQYGGRRHAA